MNTILGSHGLLTRILEESRRAPERILRSISREERQTPELLLQKGGSQHGSEACRRERVSHSAPQKCLGGVQEAREASTETPCKRAVCGTTHPSRGTEELCGKIYRGLFPDRRGCNGNVRTEHPGF